VRLTWTLWPDGEWPVVATPAQATAMTDWLPAPLALKISPAKYWAGPDRDAMSLAGQCEGADRDHCGNGSDCEAGADLREHASLLWRASVTALHVPSGTAVEEYLSRISWIPVPELAMSLSKQPPRQ
jgi:hypothetical protein